MKKNYRHTTAMLLRLVVLVLCIRMVSTFVAGPPVQQHRIRVVTQLQSSLLGGSGTNPTEKKDNKNAWTKFTDKVQSILPWTKTKQSEKVEEEEDTMLGLTKTERQELAEADFWTDLVKPFTWPITWPTFFTKDLSRDVQHALEQEERKAKPLFRQALTLMHQDNDVQNLLGDPIHLGPVVSQQTEETLINGKKTLHIVDKFQVNGAKKTGLATVSADKYAKNHILTLRVDIDGVHYDVDV